MRGETEGMLLLALHQNLMIEQITLGDQCFLVSVHSTASASCCPVCTITSRDIHSQYRWTLSNLPSNGVPVVLKLTVRRSLFLLKTHLYMTLLANETMDGNGPV